MGGIFHVRRPLGRLKSPIAHNTISSISSLIRQREPLIDIFEEEAHITVLAELPGVDEKDVNVETNENTITITAETPTEKYLKIVRLPTRINKDTIKYSYRNNILQVRLEKL